MYINYHKIHEKLWQCDCGRQFNKYTSLNSHARFCSLYKKIDTSSKYKCNNEYICECGYKSENPQSFNAHLSHCDYHHEVNNTVKKLRPSELYHTRNWENKTEEEIKEIYKKSGKTYSEKWKAGEIINCLTGMHHTDEHRKNQRLGTLKYLEKLIPNCKCRYNKNSISFINNLNKEKGWNLLHAENGGEFKFDGYFLDGYDKEKNIVFEYDEQRHYKDVYNNILKDKDIYRQNYIIEKLNCEFWRYNEKIQKLYKVTLY